MTVNDTISVIAGTARTEVIQELNGNPVKGTNVSAGAYNEGRILNKKTGEEVVVNTQAPVSPYSYKYIVKIDDTPATWEDITSFNALLRATKGFYMIKYTPKHSKDRKPGRPWKIGQDLVRWDIRVSGKRHWRRLCELVPELAWLQRNSTFNERMFDIAVLHPGMTLWFTIDWVAYEEKILAQGGPENSLVSRKCSVPNYNKDDNTALKLRYYNDILKEINEAERDPEVQAEMLAESGEVYIRGRCTEHDPVTGQFVKKKKEGE